MSYVIIPPLSCYKGETEYYYLAICLYIYIALQDIQEHNIYITIIIGRYIVRILYIHEIIPK